MTQKEPNFQIRVRATKHEPDMFYANKNLKVIEGAATARSSAGSPRCGRGRPGPRSAPGG